MKLEYECAIDQIISCENDYVLVNVSTLSGKGKVINNLTQVTHFQGEISLPLKEAKSINIGSIIQISIEVKV